MKHKLLTKFFLFGALCTIVLSLTSCPQNKQPENIKIVFDAEKIICSNRSNEDEWKDVTSGTILPEGSKLRFYSRKLPNKQIPDKWTFGNKTVTAALYADITVNKSYADKEKTIKVAYSLRDVITLKIDFDPAKLKVEKMEGRTSTPINNGDSIDERKRIKIVAINIPAEKILYNWIFKDSPVDFSKYSTVIRITTSKDYADSDNTIKIDYNLKTPEQITINYDKDKMYCDYYNSSIKKFTTVNPGQTAPEAKWIYFNLHKIEEGKVPVWTINGKNVKSNGFNYVYYFLNLDKIGAGKSVQADLSYRDGKMFTIKFDSSKIKCTKPKDGSAIENGSKLVEGTEIVFKTIDETKVKWTIGKYSYDHKANNIAYIVFGADTDTDSIEISYE